MRVVVLGLIGLFSYAAFWALDQPADLGNESDAHQMFLLRDQMSRHPGSPDFYAGEVACAFNDTLTCTERFKRIIATEPNSIAAKQAHHILAYAALREGRYGLSLREMDALLAIDPKDADAIATRPLLEALSGFPDQTVQVGGRGKTTVQMDDGELPFLINGKIASYVFDTGANLSILSESEALRLGMEIKDVALGGVSNDVNGNQVSIRVALAKSVALGGIELSNVAFLVTSDTQQPFVDMAPGHRGLIGLPVLRALGSVKWSRGGLFEVDGSPRRANIAGANLCFDDLYLIAEASFEQHEIPFVLDTGAETTDLWPKFGDVASDLIRSSGTHEAQSSIGVGGSQTFDAISIPKVVLELGGASVALQPAHVLATQHTARSKWFFGNLGLDLLGQAQDVTIDFRTMTIKLDPVTEREPQTE